MTDNDTDSGITIRASESTHWYTRDGVPRYTVTGKNGKERNTTLRDARVENLVPSVTTVLNIAAKPALTAWLQQQVLLAALTLPRRPDEPEKEYIDRIINDSKEQGRSAADAGTDIHASIQNFFEKKPVHKHHHSVYATDKKLQEVFGVQEWVSERSFAHELGFGGKSDLYLPASENSKGIVVDVKTKEFYSEADVVAYDENLLQLAAYRVGLGVPEARCGNLFVSRKVPSLVVFKEWTEEDLKRGWEMFTHLLMYWQLKNKHT